MSKEPLTSTPAGFWLRVGAKVCDWTLLFAVQFVVIGALAVLDGIVGWQPIALTMGIFAAFAMMQVVYFGVGSANGRRTAGYRLAGLQLQNLHGGALATGQSLWRAFLSMVASSLQIYGGFLNFVPAMFGPKKRTGHDLATGSQVVCIHSPRRAVLWSLPVLLLVFLALWSAGIISPSPLQVYFIPARSMEPTLVIDDRMMVNRLAYRFRAPRNGEIAVFNAPAAALVNSAGGPNQDIDFVKRVVGTPGQRVEIVRGSLHIDGAPVAEPSAKWRDGPLGALPAELEFIQRYDMKIVGKTIYSRDYVAPDQPGLWTKNNVEIPDREQKSISAAKPGVVPADQFLMLGDNRSNSNDSHVWGFAPRGAFIGRAMNLFWPLARWRTFR